MKSCHPRILKVKAGAGSASTGLWMRSRKELKQLFLLSVAHVLYKKDGRLRYPVKVAGAKANICAITRFNKSYSCRTDASLLSLSDDFVHQNFKPATGHLNRFYKGLKVGWRNEQGELIEGYLERSDWAGYLSYKFGSRRLIKQWVIQSTPQNKRLNGHSGIPWVTKDGIAVGLQVGIIPRAPGAILITPIASICQLFDVVVAG